MEAIHISEAGNKRVIFLFKSPRGRCPQAGHRATGNSESVFLEPGLSRVQSFPFKTLRQEHVHAPTHPHIHTHTQAHTAVLSSLVVFPGAHTHMLLSCLLWWSSLAHSPLV